MAKKSLLSITEIEDKTKQLIENLNQGTFIEEFLELFDIPRTSITRAKNSDGDFFIRNKVQYRKVKFNPLEAMDEIIQEIEEQKRKPRYIITTDFHQLYAKDTTTNDTLAIDFEDLAAYADFFLAWNGIEKVDYQKENPADIKAAERFTKLYDELVKINLELAKEEVEGKSFNLFLIRALFLYFAEDTEIIAKGSFTNILKTRTKEDGSDLNLVIKALFEVLDVPENKREKTPEWLNEFPYVNGKLFKEPHHDLVFSAYTRKLLIEAGELLKWNEINPDILGAMIQTVANKEARQVAGMHYTSVPNIMKVIKPLFLDELITEFERLSDSIDYYLSATDLTGKHVKEYQKDNVKNLYDLLNRMSKIKFLDPACGSGNFLIITYKELRRLEIKILLKIQELQGDILINSSEIKLSNFSGIEIDDFAHKVARLSLYIAEHQMNVELTTAIPNVNPSLLPLKESGNIIHANALRVDWNEIVPHGADDEVYIMGNPPYIGAKNRTETQKEDLEIAIGEDIKFGNLDYISGWFYKGVIYIEDSSATLSFVTTNSICQGIQVSLLWEFILNHVEISFAYSSFKWGNQAKNNAGVSVVIIGLFKCKDSHSKKIFDDNMNYIEVENITPYLTQGDTIFVKNHTQSISELPSILSGSSPYDGNNLIVSYEKYIELNRENSPAIEWIKLFIGGDEFINGKKRYVIHLTKQNYEEACTISFISERVRKTQLSRLQSKRETTRRLAETPYLFGEDRYKESNMAICIPVTSSEGREYVPMGIINSDMVISKNLFGIYDAELWLLGVLQSKMHMVWFKSIGGKMKTDYSYSAGMVYNTFPIPPLSTQRKNILEEAVLEMLDVREEEGGTLAELYGGANKPMNARLRKAHEKIDGIVERAYRQEPFKSDEERLSVLLKLYQKMTGEENGNV
ncbi:class I SAM-dependent DNA methyltransferase [Lactovum odontotermitis]